MIINNNHVFILIQVKQNKLTMFLIATIIVLLLTIFYLIPSPKPYAGVYSRPGNIIFELMNDDDIFIRRQLFLY